MFVLVISVIWIKRFGVVVVASSIVDVSIIEAIVEAEAWVDPGINSTVMTRSGD